MPEVKDLHLVQHKHALLWHNIYISGRNTAYKIYI